MRWAKGIAELRKACRDDRAIEALTPPKLPWEGLDELEKPAVDQRVADGNCQRLQVIEGIHLCEEMHLVEVLVLAIQGMSGTSRAEISS